MVKTATEKEGSSTPTLREIILVRSAGHDGASALRSASAVNVRVYRMLCGAALCCAVHPIWFLEARQPEGERKLGRRGVAGLKAVLSAANNESHRSLESRNRWGRSPKGRSESCASQIRKFSNVRLSLSCRPCFTRHASPDASTRMRAHFTRNAGMSKIGVASVIPERVQQASRRCSAAVQQCSSLLKFHPSELGPLALCTVTVLHAWAHDALSCAAKSCIARSRVHSSLHAS